MGPESVNAYRSSTNAVQLGRGLCRQGVACEHVDVDGRFVGGPVVACLDLHVPRPSRYGFWTQTTKIRWADTSRLQRRSTWLCQVAAKARRAVSDGLPYAQGLNQARLPQHGGITADCGV
jgi:hypothetical protein